MASKAVKAPWKVFGIMEKLSAPIIAAPMSGVSGPELASSVAKAGGLGFIGAGMMKDAKDLQRDFERAVELNGGRNNRLGIGLVGFTGSWLVDTAISLRPDALWISFGDYREAAAKIMESSIPLMIMVQSVEEALRAGDLDADAIVAQGSESGGHGCGPTSTLCFVPEVIDALQQAGKGHIPVLAAGGISDGRQMAAALALGAAGAVVGTRFAVTRESMLSEAKKQRYVAAKAADTQRVRIYDDLGALDWPVGIDGRIIGNAFTLAHGSATLTEEEQQRTAKEELAKATQDGNLDVVPLWCGAGIGMVHSVESAEDAFDAIWAGARARFVTLADTYL